MSYPLWTPSVGGPEGVWRGSWCRMRAPYGGLHPIRSNPRENIPVFPAYDWSVVRINPCFLHLIGHASPATAYTHPKAADAGRQGNGTDNEPGSKQATIRQHETRVVYMQRRVWVGAHVRAGDEMPEAAHGTRAAAVFDLRVALVVKHHPHAQAPALHLAGRRNSCRLEMVSGSDGPS
eukprot:7405426-Pyramimonas_sp.AAC.1